LDNNIKGTDNYIEKYLPFKILQMTMDGLATVLDKKQSKKLQDFHTKKYKEFHGTILDDNGEPNLDKFKADQN